MQRGPGVQALDTLGGFDAIWDLILSILIQNGIKNIADQILGGGGGGLLHPF